jgi:hypothetical protein
MKARIIANSLSGAMKKCMKVNSSPMLIFKDEEILVNCEQVKSINVEGRVLESGWGRVEYLRAEKVIQVLDVIGDGQVTIEYENGGLRFSDFRL